MLAYVQVNLFAMVLLCNYALTVCVPQAAFPRRTFAVANTAVHTQNCYVLEVYMLGI